MPYDLSACGLVTVSDFLVQDSQTTGKGVVLRNGDRPLVTRGWDCFTSGDKAGIGRWGVFMEAAELFVAAPGTDYTGGKVGLGGFLADGTKQNTLTVATDTRRVGIGTCAPEAPLNIRCDSSSGAAFLRILTCNNNAGRRLDINAGTGIEYTIPDGTSQSPYIQIEGGSVPAGGGSFRIRTGAIGGVADRLTVTQAGNVGIATTSPRYALDVAGGMMGNFYMSCCNTSIDGSGPFDYGIVGTGNIAGALLVNDIVGARYSIAGGNYNLTFRKSVRGTSTACAYCTVMTFVGSTDTNCVVNVNIANSLGVGVSPSERLAVGGLQGQIQLRVDTSDGSTINVRPNAGRCGWISYTEDAVADRWGIGIKNGDAKLYFASGNVGVGGGTTRMVLDGSGNMGLGTEAPGTNLEVYGTDAEIIVHNQSNSRGGLRAFCNQRLGILTTSSSDDLVFGFESTLKGTFTERMRICSNSGRVGIGTSTPSYLLHVNGTFYAAGSSIDYKEGICQYDTNSCLFMCLKPKTYQYKDEWKHLGKELKSETQIGLIAEEVAEVMPELAILVEEDNNKVVRNVDYEKLSIVLLAEVQKLRKEVDQLKQSC